MKWFIVLAFALVFPLRDVAAEELSASVSSGAHVLTAGAPPPGPRPQTTRNDAVKDTFNVGLGFTLGGFRSSSFNSLVGGLKSSVTYYFQEHLAVEGTITSTFDLQSSNDSDAKYVFYGGGLRVRWGRRKLQPFVHALLGGVHLFPQTAYSNNGIGGELGGGVEKRMSQRVWLQFEGDYVPSYVHGASQNNFQGVVGFIYRF